MRGSKSSGRRDGDLVLQGRDFLFGVSEKFGKKTEVMFGDVIGHQPLVLI